MQTQTPDPIQHKTPSPYGPEGLEGLDGRRPKTPSELGTFDVGPEGESSNDTEGPGAASAAEPHGHPGLPCLLSEQLNPTICKKSLPARHRRLAVELEVMGLVMRYGVERIGFLTFTFADDVKTVPEASRRMNSLLTNQLSKRYAEWLSVVQRHKDGKIHFHFVVVLAEDVRTGFDFAQVRHRDYSSASPYLRAEWAWLRATLPEYSFGRHELLPVRVTEGFGRYVARYVAGNTKRQASDRGARLVRFSRTFVRVVCGAFTPWNFIAVRVRKRKQDLITKWPSLSSVVENTWLPSVRSWLPWLLWSAPEGYYVGCLMRTEDDLQLYGGAAFALQERTEEYRERWLRAVATDTPKKGAGVKVTPDRSETVETHAFPGLAWLARS